MFDNLTDPIPPVGPDSNAITKAVQATFTSYLEESNPGETRLTFFGSSPSKILHFGSDTDWTVIYTTLSYSTETMQGSSAMAVDINSGPHVKFILPTRGRLGEIIRPLGILAALPGIEGLILAEGAPIDFGQPPWDQSRFTGLVLLETEIPPVAVGETEVTIFQPVLTTTNEFALARAKGVDELRQVWETQGTDSTDPHHTSVV